MINGDQKTLVVKIDGEVLLPNDSLAIVSHSPSGFAWGYGGSGPSQLALALLLHFTDKDFAVSHYQNFKHEILGQFRHDRDLNMSDTKVINWARELGYEKNNS